MSPIVCECFVVLLVAMVTESAATNVGVLCFSNKVQAVAFASLSKQLVSTCDDRVVAFWDMDVKRQEVGVSSDRRWVCLETGSGCACFL